MRSTVARSTVARSSAALALLLAAALVQPALTGRVLAQTANVSPTSPSSASSGDVSRTAPSGSTAIPTPGQPQIGAPTPTERHYEHKAEKAATSVCKGC